ncbi:hypothetical protein HFU84_02215 [Acidithiobacillus sp. CV18-2]|uniref:HEAT repeat domain-containing protein n=2 Tax=Acidithiobacillaceae TaxID=225058 RepID=A0AAE2YPB7_9PROT|nr:HEAT repeat domain-containing protein [Igneacidithiobacillus copahuensis]MBU2753628.1 hypothetical protein [Acidithiobacillus sp. CV18-3]MBU2758520.1 hypothetical protein [Acidithiobacillus sp. BN09-2]MBU2776346.1 hypothetical protein [Acidithiobacillus sp. CV18-2]MBU2795262.1 hypothetical protein [Acidithiobacillus sp. VAN18-2]MBU2799512.1 hypothetical protein [Acidithiobacillus sp. VAN18-4]UTV81311.1 HEAT repeat domain-containing protein [Acidithiobacillus sp. YTS05]
MDLLANGGVSIEVLEIAVLSVVLLFVMDVIILVYSKNRAEKISSNYLLERDTFIQVLRDSLSNSSISMFQNLDSISYDALTEAIHVVCLEGAGNIERLQPVITGSGIVSHYLKQISDASSRPYQRAHGYLHLSRLPVVTLKPQLAAAIDRELARESSQEGANVAKAVGLLVASQLCTTATDLHHFMERLAEGELFAAGFVEGLTYRAIDTVTKHIGREATESVCLSLLPSLATAKALQYAVIATAGRLALTRLAGPIAELDVQEKNDNILKISCLRSLAAMRAQGPGLDEVIQGDILHADWRVRATACTTAATLALRGSVHLLEKALSDEAYYVRLNAARALSTLGASQVLETYAYPGAAGDTPSDSYRTSVCLYVLNRMTPNDSVRRSISY